MDRRTFLALAPAALIPAPARTTLSIDRDRFLINGRPTYQNRSYKGMKMEGLLMNSRMVQGVFDDLNPETRSRWAYPDTKRWDPERNAREFIAAMPQWRRHGLLAFTINLQGGSPEGYSKAQPWENSAFEPDGSLRPAYMGRLERILNRADELGMVVIVGCFYFGQDQRLNDDAAVKNALGSALKWLRGKAYRNLLIEIANECDNRSYDRDIIRAARIHELIEMAKSQGFLAGASFNGGRIPSANVVAVSDFLLLHGNGVSDPNRIAQMVAEARQVPGYRPMPVLFNEDDHFDFDKPVNNMLKAVGSYASWGYFDPEGYQCPPVNWGLNTNRKKAFFGLLKEVTGA